MIRVDTQTYKIHHGHTPRQAPHWRVSRWAFQIDHQPQPVVITAPYTEALRRAKALAQDRVTVLP